MWDDVARLFYTASHKSVRYLLFYNLKKPESIFIVFGMQYPDNPSVKSIRNFASTFILTSAILQFSGWRK